MERLTNEQLIKEGIKHVKHKGETYFPSHVILSKYPDARLKTKVTFLNLDFGDEVTLGIRADDFTIMTDFDKKIAQTLNFNPKGK